MACTVFSLLQYDERYQEVKSWYGDPNIEDYRVVGDLWEYRLFHDVPDDWMPSPDEKDEFMSFAQYSNKIKWSDDNHKKTKSARIAVEDVAKTYVNMLSLGLTRQQMEARINYIKRGFTYRINQVLVEDRSLSIPGAIRKLGGYANIMKRIFNSYKNATEEDQYNLLVLRFGEPKTEEQKKLMQDKAKYVTNWLHKMAENEKRFAKLASRSISESYGIIIDHTGMEMDFRQDTDEADSQNEDTGTQGERYIDTRTMKVMDTISTECKVLLSDIPVLDLAGKRSYDDMMQPKLVDPKQIAYVMPEVLMNSTPETMIEDMKAACGRYPFLQGLVNKLEGKYDSKDADNQALVYTFFKKAKNIYTYTKLEKGSYKTEKANTKAQGNSLTRRMSLNMNGTVLEPTWSIYDNTGKIVDNIDQIKSEVESALKEYDQLGFVNTLEGGYDKRKEFKANGERSNYASLTDYSIYSRENGSQAAMEMFFADHPDFLPNLLKAARGLGLDITEQNLRDAAVAPIAKKSAKTFGFMKTNSLYGGNRLDQVVEWVRDTYKKAASKSGDELVYTSAPMLYNSLDSNSLNKINYSMGVAFFDELEPRTLSGNSTLSTYTYPNLIHETMDLLNNESGLSEEDFKQSLNDNFLRFRGYALNGNPTGWLKRVFDNTPKEAVYELYSMTQFNGVDYERMSLPQKFAAQLSMWANPRMRAIESNIMSDYTGAWHFIKNAGLGRQGWTRSEIIKARDEEMKRALDEYKAESGKEMSFNERTKVLTEIENELINENSRLKRLDGTYRTDWPIVKELVDEVLIEYNTIKQTKLDIAQNPDGLSGPVFKTQRERGVLFHIFPEFNSMNVESELDKLINSNSSTEDYLSNLVAEQLSKIVESDIRYIESIGALKNPILKNTVTDETGNYVSVYSESGEFSKLSPKAQVELETFFLDNFYGRMQAAKILNGGLSNFNGILDYEKRNMMLYAPARPVYTKAKWNGKQVGREDQRAMYLNDEKTASVFYNAANEMLGVLESQGLITPSQRKRMAGSYNKITTTDGQAFRTYESYRVVQIELGKWDQDRENVYQYLVNNKGSVTKKELAREFSKVYNTVEKPRFAGWEIVGDQKIPVLHKYAETVLFPVQAIEKLGGVPTQLRGLAMAAEELSKNEPFDIFLFNSCVKVGGFSSADPFGYVKEDGKEITDDNGNKVRNCNTPEEIRDYIVAVSKTDPWSIHTLAMKYYGEAASTPAHTEDDSIAWSSQAEKDLFGNILPGDEIEVNGEKIPAERARAIFDDCNAVSVIERFQKLRSTFRDTDQLRLTLMDELASKSYSNPELEYALSNPNVPLFFPSIRLGAEQIFLSIIKKRLTRPKTKGANILQVTSFGYDVDPFGESWGISDDRKLRVVTDGEGENMRVKEVEVYISVHDSRLEPFLDSTGGISPERLQKLIDDNIIPEELVKFVAYRTPSDDMHSIIPCRIKGFLPKTYGANIIMPKEIMNMTGHDFDGDKLRCHFQDFKVNFGKELDEEYAKLSEDKNIVRAILGQDNSAVISKKKFTKNWAQDVNHYTPGVISMYQYDYSKPAYENGQIERDNAKVQLAFGMLTSPAGSRRMVIPGGSSETDVMGAAFEITRKVHDNPNLKAPIEEKYNVDFSTNAKTLNSLLKLDNRTLSEILDYINGSITSFSLRHSLEAFDYIIGGKKMISIYALHASAALMMQRLDVHMKPVTYVDKNGKRQLIPAIGFFNSPIDKLFNVKNNKDQLGSLFMSEAINSAVDNGKNPRLGFLNQSPELAEMTAFLNAAGLTMKQIHLVLNQPAMVELVRRMKEPKVNFNSAVNQLMDELRGNTNVFNKFSSHLGAAKRILAVTEDEWADSMPYHYDELFQGYDMDLRINQLALLRVMKDLYIPAMELTQYVKNTRPEAASSGVGSTLSKTAVIIDELNQTREIEEPTISGLRGVFAHRNAFYNDSTEKIYENISTSGLRQVTALQSLMQDQVFPMLSRYFPLAKNAWRSLALNLANEHGELKASDIQKITDEMVLWNLQKNKGFIEDLEEERKDLLTNTPHDLMELKNRIAKEALNRAKKEPVKDRVAAALIDNAFINHLFVEKPEGPDMKPRIAFSRGGAAMDNLAEAISYDWMALYQMDDPQCKKLALDLFKYNTFTNGFGYGMYEFAHFAPYPIIEKVPGYLEVLKGIQDSYEFALTPQESRSFAEQFFANHWQDERLVPHVTPKQLPDMYRAALNLKLLPRKTEGGVKVDPNAMSPVLDKPFFALYENKKYTLYQSLLTENGLELREVPKLGTRTKRNQVTVQYNPELELIDMVPFQVGTDSVWGDFQNMMVLNSEEANLEDTTNQTVSDEEAQNYADQALKYGERPTAAKYTKQIEKRINNIEAELNAAVKANMKNADALKDNSDIGAEAVVNAEQMLDNVFKNEAPDDTDRVKSLFTTITAEEGEMGPQETMFYLASYQDEKLIEKQIPNTPENVRLIRRQKAYTELWDKLTNILAQHGIKPGVLARTQAVMEEAWGMTNFDAADVVAAGLGELIKLSENKEKAMIALPEEFAHLALEMLGHDDPLVGRLLELLKNDDSQLRAAYGENYDIYEKVYEGDKNKLALEAAGKLVSEALLLEQERLSAEKAQPLVKRIVEKIKNFLRKIGSKIIGDAILDAHQVSSKLARGILSGDLVDKMDLDKVKSKGNLYHMEKIEKDLTNRNSVLDRILKQELQRLSLLKRRSAHSKDDKRSAAEVATEKQVALLEKGIRDHKLESVINDYLKASLQFLRDTEASLEQYVNAGYRANTVCKKLNAIRDTICSYANVMKVLDEGAAAGEFIISKELSKAMADMKLEVDRFQQQYQNYGMMYFERMLAGIYGEHGITHTLGKKRGQVLSIQEMARKTDRDINVLNRMLSSLADTGDYVLAAFDFITRQAKIDGRRRTATIVPKLNEAFERLKREGFDQDFMFEYSDGKRTGKYIAKTDKDGNETEEYKKLSDAQKHFYDTVMDIKKEVDACLPPGVIKDPRQIICLRKYGFDRIASANGISKKWDAFVENVRNSVLDTSDNLEYDKEEVIKDFEGNRIDMLPIHYTNKSKNESWDDMTEDVAQSILAYAGMGFEFNEMNGIVGVLENARYMALNREVEQHSGNRQQVQRIRVGNDSEEFVFEAPFTKKQERTNIQKILDDFFQMQVYGKLQKEEGTIGHTRISKRKLANKANALASYTQMAFNLQQRISNVTAGMSNIIIETAGKGVYNAGDFAWGLKEYMKQAPNRAWETGKLETDNKLSLFAERFDLHQNNGKSYNNYNKKRISRVVNTSLLFAGLNMGEDLLALTSALAIARRHKVRTADGKESNLWEAYEVKYTDSVNKTGAYLQIKKGWTEPDGSPIDNKVEDSYARLVIGTNFRLQGIYNNDDKAAIQQYAFGSLIMMYRKWIHPAIMRRYGGTGYNPLTGTEGEGYWRTFGHWIGDSYLAVAEDVRAKKDTELALNLFQMVRGMGASMMVNWNKMTDYEKSNLYRAFTELGIMLTSFLAIGLLSKLPPDDKERMNARMATWFDNMALYQLYRARNELGSVAPTPLIFNEIDNTLSNPMAAWRPLHALVRVPLLLLPSSWTTEIKSGRYRGHVKAYKYMMDLPVVSMWKQFEHFKDPTSLINYYKADF